MLWRFLVQSRLGLGQSAGRVRLHGVSGLRSATLTRRFSVNSQLGLGVARKTEENMTSIQAELSTADARFLAILPLIPLNLYQITEEKESFFTVFRQKTSKKSVNSAKKCIFP